MPAKLKPSSKEYVRDSRGKMTKQWKWKHYTPATTSTEELNKLLENSSYKKKRSIILKELEKRNA
jgi:hypothetical protein